MVDQQPKNGSFNGSFLVLNLGTNTLEVGNSFAHPCPSEAFHQNPAVPTPNHPNLNNINDAFDTSSTEEGSFSTSDASGTKRGSDEEEDPEWVPEKKAPKISSSANKTIKPSERPSVDPNPPQVSAGGFNGMPNLSSGPPPMHLMGLLSIFGWKVVFQPGKGEYVYISPNGLPYFSLPKAFETFLRGTSKYSEKAISSSYLCVGNENYAEGSGKKQRGRRQKSFNVDETNTPIELSDDQLQPNDNPLIDSGEKSLQMAETVECQEAAHASSLCKADEKTQCHAEDRNLGDKLNLASFSTGLVGWGSHSGRRSAAKCRRSVGLRRSGRFNKKNEVSDRDQGTEKQDECNFSATRMDAGMDVVNEKTDDSASAETKRSDCSSMFFSSESNATDRHWRHETSGIRRSVRINGKRVPVDDDSDFEIVFDEHFLCSSKLVMAKKDKEKPVISSHLDTSGYQMSRLDESCASLSERSMELAVSANCSPPYIAEGKLVDGGKSNRKKKKTRRGGCGLTVRRNGQDDHQEEILPSAKINVLSWLIDRGTLAENERVYYITPNGARNTPGFVTRRGVWCNCCKELVPLSKFVAHAGGSLHQPWDNIFLLSGRTLLLCLKESWEKEKVQRNIEYRTVGVGDPDPSDDTCGICADGGHLICCDGCPSTFHQTCLMLKTLPEGSWYCPYCICTFCMAMVRESDTLLSCIQCGRKYHKSCAWRNNSDLTGSIPFSFCGKNCQKVATAISDMLGITNHIEDGISWTLLKHFDEDSRIISNQRLSFIMESNIKLSMALSVLDECFVPLVDQRTGVDMICQAIYNCGSNFNRLNYERFYTVILERDEEIISAASLRLHGTSLAEMPFIGTRSMYRRQGMCRRLLKAVEDILCSLHVEKLIIPAISDLLETWTNSFSFKHLEPAHREEIKNLSLMVFAETTLLQKPIHSTSAFAQEDVVPPDDTANCSKNLRESGDLHGTFVDQKNTRNHFGNRTHAPEGRDLEKSFGDQINTRSHFGSGNNMEDSKVHRSYGDQINMKSRLVDTGSSYGGNIHCSHELQRSLGNQINTSCGNIIQASNKPDESFGDQINDRNTSGDNGFGYDKNVHDIHELHGSFGHQRNPMDHFGSGSNTQEIYEQQRSVGDQIHIREHLVGSGINIEKNIHNIHDPQRSFGYKIKTGTNSGTRNNIHECQEVHGCFAHQRGNRCHNDPIPMQQTATTNLSSGPHNLAADRAHVSSANLHPNISNGSISKASPLQGAFVTNGCSAPSNLTSSITPGLAGMPPNISKGSITDSTHVHRTVMTNIDTVSNNIPASISPDSFTMHNPNIRNGSISDASSFEHVARSNNSIIPRNPATESFAAPPIAAPNSQVYSTPQGDAELRSLQMDAVRSSISFDNLSRAVS